MGKTFIAELEDVGLYKKKSRKWEIISVLLDLLQKKPFTTLTTASIAHSLGVSEAALYRHFSSKDRMFSALIETIEALIYLRINKIERQSSSAIAHCYDIATTWIVLAEQHPSIACVLSGFFLQGASEQLVIQHARFCERFETTLKRSLKESVHKDGVCLSSPQVSVAALIMTALEGHVIRYIRSGYLTKPSLEWPTNWKALMKSMIL